MTKVSATLQSLSVATENLLTGALPERELARHGDCIAAYQRELDYLCRTLRRLGVAPADLEDVAHDVFVVVHRRWADYDASFPLRPWLFGIAFRVASAHRKRAKREVLAASVGVDIEDLAPHPDQVVAVEEARALVLAALERIPLPRRAVLVMHDLDGAAMHDIAQVLSIPLFTAYSRLRKARVELEASVLRLRKGFS